MFFRRSLFICGGTGHTSYIGIGSDLSSGKYLACAENLARFGNGCDGCMSVFQITTASIFLNGTNRVCYLLQVCFHSKMGGCYEWAKKKEKERIKNQKT